MLVPSEANVVSVEDRRELHLPHELHEHWISRSTTVDPRHGKVALFDLLKESLRQSPDYIVIGEVSGPEAYLVFQGMSSGHASISTFKAESFEMMIRRLTAPPIELPKTLIGSLDVVTVMTNANVDGRLSRRMKEIAEIENVDPKTGEIKKRTIFRWNPASDGYEKIGESMKVARIAAVEGITFEGALAEIEKRKKFLLWMEQQHIRDYGRIAELINFYNKEPAKLEEQTGIKSKKSEKKKEKVSILSLLGFRFIKEKTDQE
jgi:flagellar protein FlaI